MIHVRKFTAEQVLKVTYFGKKSNLSFDCTQIYSMLKFRTDMDSYLIGAVYLISDILPNMENLDLKTNKPIKVVPNSFG